MTYRASPALGLLVLVVALATPSPAATSTPGEGDPQVLSKRFVEWLKEVDPLITLPERRAFLELKKDYQRDAFIREFWRVRDPHPKTARNELKERWLDRLETVQAEFGSLDDDRSRIFLVHGPPAGLLTVRCSTTRTPVQVWFYQGSDVVDFRFLLVFVRHQGIGPARLWRPGSASHIENILRNARSCMHGHRLGDVLKSIRREGYNYDVMMDRILAKPKPRSEEWVATFASYTTDLPEEALLFDAELHVDFLGRHRQRTVVQAVVRIPTKVVGVAEFAGYRSYDFVVTGEVVLKDQLFESFRYKFDFPVGDLPSAISIPLAVQRYLRPGEYFLIIKVEDLNSNRFYRGEQPLRVPKMDNVVDVEITVDPETARLFEEATAAVAAGETTIHIIPPAGELQTGFVRFDTLATGSDIDKVAFLLDGKLALTRNHPPFNVELDLGPFPRLRSLRVEALNDAGAVVAEDELLINAGGQRFVVRLLEPRRGKSYDRSLRAHADVEIPEGKTLERVEFYLNETLVATLYQGPYVQPLALPASSTISYVRAVAYLTDGNSTADLVFINAPDYLEELDVHFVELYAAAVDKSGRPVTGLDRGDFSISEDDVRQEILRFEQAENLPIHVGILVDNSASMRGALQTTRKAALRFFQEAITPSDRAAVITFNRFPRLAVKLTNDLTSLGGGLAGLTAEGQTALYDSLMFALYYFAGIKGQRAILLLSDGKDESSRFDFSETLEYARRAGVTIYAIGLQSGDSARRKLTQLAGETGGNSYFIRDVEELTEIYDAIQTELRSQYLIAYQSSNTTHDGKFRAVELTVHGPGVTVKTMSGYYP